MNNNSQININKLREENALLLYQLHQVQEEFEKICPEKQQLKNNSFESNSRKLYGAANRIRNDLPYKLGRKFIENSKSIKGWICMPWQLRRVFLDFQKETKDLPPISFFADASEAEKVKQNLSYRFGSVILNRSLLLGWITFPFSLYKTYADFKKGKVWKESAEPISAVRWRFIHFLPGFYKLEARNVDLDLKLKAISFQVHQAKAERDQAKAERDQAKAERDQAKAERDQAKAERDQAKAERDQAKAERDQAKAERDQAKTERNQFKGLSDELMRVRKYLDAVIQREVKNAACQVQASAAVQHYLGTGELLPFHPESDNWPITPDFTFILIQLLETRNYDLVVEFGSGLSTLLVTRCLEKINRKRQGKPPVRFLSFDHLPEFHGRTLALLQQAGTADRVELCLAPLADYAAPNGQTYPYYACQDQLAAIGAQSLAGLKVLAIVDGPPAATGEHARYPAGPILAHAFSGAQIDIILDDMIREDERQVAKLWEEEFRAAGRACESRILKLKKEACLLHIQ